MSSSSKCLIIGNILANIPWEEKPAGCDDIIWRSKDNPIIPRDLLPNSNSIFNSAVVPYKNRFAGIFRCDDQRRYMRIHRGFSDDGKIWQIDNDPIHLKPDNQDIAELNFGFAYDPRVCWLEDRYYITWCNAYEGDPTIGLAYTHDFETFHQMENIFLPYNRNGVLFPRMINGNYMILSRPSDQ